MSPAASTVRTHACRIKLSGDGRWVSMSLSLREITADKQVIVSAENLEFDLVGLDEITNEFGLSNWQGGIISGARYAFRKLKAPLHQICIHELHGQLGSGDIGAISSAAAIGVARLLGSQAEFPLDLAGWKMAGCLGARP